MTPTSLWPGRVRAAFGDVVGDEVAVEDEFGPVQVDVPVEAWADSLRLARDGLDCSFFDFLTAVDEWRPEPGEDDGFRVVCHVAARPGRRRAGSPAVVEHLVVRTLVPRAEPRLASVAGVYPGARWHERETHEMFGVQFTEDGQVLQLEKLLLPEEFEGHPLRKEFVLASRVAKPWPGAKEPGESEHAPAAGRRRTKPPGVPDDWPVRTGPATDDQVGDADG